MNAKNDLNLQFCILITGLAGSEHKLDTASIVLDSDIVNMYDRVMGFTPDIFSKLNVLSSTGLDKLFDLGKSCF